jgi:hypothetical protein
VGRLSITIDPSSLVIRPELDVDILEEHVLDLVDLSQSVRDKWLFTQLIANALETLAEAGLLPLRNVLEEQLKRAGVTSVGSRDLEQVIFSLLEHSVALEDALLVSAVLSDQLVIEPASAVADLAPPMAEARTLTLELLALGIAHRCVPAGDILTLGGANGTVSVSGVLDSFDPIHDSCSLTPGAFAASLTLHSSMSSLRMVCRTTDLLRSPVDDSQVIAAIGLETYRLLGSSAPVAWSDIPEIHLGASFTDSLRNVGAFTSPALARRILVAAAEVVCQTGLRKTHSLRTNSKGGSASVRLGSWNAFRHDVDYEIHLHYWRGDDGRVELAAAVFHNDFEIPVPSEF